MHAGKCSNAPLLLEPPELVDGVKKTFKLCEAKPWFRYTVKVSRCALTCLALGCGLRRWEQMQRLLWRLVLVAAASTMCNPACRRAQVKTRGNLGDGTDAPIDVTWWCGSQAGTSKRVPIQQICEDRGDIRCFES